jgi:tight adherence protein C
MAETLRVFAEDMRAHRLLKAEEKAHTVTVKLTLVLAGCFLPAILIAILAPVAFQIIAGFAKLAAPP